MCTTGEPLDVVKGSNTSTGVFRKTEKQSYSRANGGVVRVEVRVHEQVILTMSFRLDRRPLDKSDDGR